MKSIPAAMTWELFDRGRWLLPAAALGSLAFPVLILTALRGEGSLLASDPSMFIMHFVLVQMNAAMFGSALVAHSLNLSRHYAYPVTAATLVTWRLLPLMVAMALETVAWTAALNALFPLNWPLWGPAMFSAAALAAVLAPTWLMYRSRWVVVALAIIGGLLGLWLKARYGGLFSYPRHAWHALAPIEALALAGLAAASWWAGIVGVARNRRGEPPFTLGIVAWLERLLDRTPSAHRRFRTPAHAQFWYASRRFWFMPAVVASILLGCLIAWLLGSRDPRDVVDGLWHISRGMMVVALMGGLVMADTGASGNFVLRQFQATRPLTTTSLARTHLRAAAASLLAAWALWAVAALATCAVLAALGTEPAQLVPIGFTLREIPATFLASWVIAAAWLFFVMTGRSELLTRLLCGLTAAFIVLVVVTKFTLPQETRDLIFKGLAAALGIGCVLGTAWMYWAARRRGLVESPTTWAALAAWVALVVVGLLLFPQALEAPLTASTLALGLLALVVAPWAAAPLALAWNRHR